MKLDLEFRKVLRRYAVLGEKRRERRATTGRKAREVIAFAFNRQVAMGLGNKKPVLATASAAPLTEDDRRICGVCCSTVRQRPHVFRQALEGLEPAGAEPLQSADPPEIWNCSRFERVQSSGMVALERAAKRHHVQEPS